MTVKRGPGRPPKLADPTPVDDSLTARARAVVASGVGVMEDEMNALAAASLGGRTDADLERVITITEKAATTMSHLRRHDESVRNAGRKLSLPVVLAWAREQSDEVKGQIADALGLQGAPGESVLS